VGAGGKAEASDGVSNSFSPSAEIVQCFRIIFGIICAFA